MTGIHASKRRKEVACLERRGRGDICDFSPASQIHSLLFCTCSVPEQYPLFIKEIFISHLPLASRLSLISERKKKPGRKDQVCSGAAIVSSRMDRCTNTLPVTLRTRAGEWRKSCLTSYARREEEKRACKLRNSGKKLSQPCLLVCKFAGKDGYSLSLLRLLFSSPPLMGCQGVACDLLTLYRVCKCVCERERGREKGGWGI